jgi:hypothetical protein
MQQQSLDPLRVFTAATLQCIGKEGAGQLLYNLWYLGGRQPQGPRCAASALILPPPLFTLCDEDKRAAAGAR